MFPRVTKEEMPSGLGRWLSGFKEETKMIQIRKTNRRNTTKIKVTFRAQTFRTPIFMETDDMSGDSLFLEVNT